jgi:glycerol-3-phosphate dehydrogenase
MQRDFKALTETTFDVVLVGGGIYGVALAREAALRGLATALVEQRDFGSGTSANSLKIIHGGLRYLQQFDIPRVLESVRERRTMLHIAPHLVHPLPCAMPTGRALMQSRPAMFAGMLANDILSFDRNRGSRPDQWIPRGRLVTRAEAAALLPADHTLPFSGAARWWDAYADNTERLGLDMLRDAVRAGAVVANYAALEGGLREGDRYTGIRVRDRQTGDTLDVRGRMIVNCTGPWTNATLARLDGALKPLPYELALGMNIVLNRQLMPDCAVGLPSRLPGERTSRLLFFMPWRGVTMVGTYYRHHTATADALRPNAADLDLFLAQANAALPSAELTRRDVARIQAGLLPATPGRRDPTPALLRHYRLVDHERTDGVGGLISILGVKYTTARDVAQRVIALACRKLGIEARPSDSATRRLPGGEQESVADCLAQARAAAPAGVSEGVIANLVANYGSDAPRMLMDAGDDTDQLRTVTAGSPVVELELRHAVEQEMALTLSDVVFRRTDLGSARMPTSAALQACAGRLAPRLGWNAERVAAEIAAVQDAPDVRVP